MKIYLSGVKGGGGFENLTGEGEKKLLSLEKEFLDIGVRSRMVTFHYKEHAEVVLKLIKESNKP